MWLSQASWQTEARLIAPYQRRWLCSETSVDARVAST